MKIGVLKTENMAINRGTLEKIRFDLTADTLNVLAINSIGSFVHKHLVPYNLSGMTPAGTHLPIASHNSMTAFINTAVIEVITLN